MSAESVLAAMAARAEASTPGPWTTYRDGIAASAWVLVDEGRDLYAEGSDPNTSTPVCMIESDSLELSPDRGDADAAFIAAARQDVPALVAALRAVLALHRPITTHDECDHEDRDECDAWETTDGLIVCGPNLGSVCEECRNEDGDHYVDHPCATVAAVTAALEES
jgi:hypothetical protein